MYTFALGKHKNQTHTTADDDHFQSDLVTEKENIKQKGTKLKFVLEFSKCKKSENNNNKNCKYLRNKIYKIVIELQCLKS